jgi:hypothetical protein
LAASFSLLLFISKDSRLEAGGKRTPREDTLKTFHIFLVRHR